MAILYCSQLSNYGFVQNTFKMETHTQTCTFFEDLLFIHKKVSKNETLSEWKTLHGKRNLGTSAFLGI